MMTFERKRELTKVFLESPKGRTYGGRWKAIYRTGIGWTHVALPFGDEVSLEDATRYAEENPPE